MDLPFEKPTIFLIIKYKVMRSVIKRMNRATPQYFKKLRNTGLFLSAVSAGVFAIPVGLPVIVIQVAGYLAVAGTVASAVSQTAVKYERK